MIVYNCDCFPSVNEPSIYINSYKSYPSKFDWQIARYQVTYSWPFMLIWHLIFVYHINLLDRIFVAFRHLSKCIITLHYFYYWYWNFAMSYLKTYYSSSKYHNKSLLISLWLYNPVFSEYCNRSSKSFFDIDLTMMSGLLIYDTCKYVDISFEKIHERTDDPSTTR